MAHVYERVATVRPRVEVAYGARFRVQGGRWRPVVGTVGVVSAPVRLRVLEAEPVLVTPSR